MRDMIIWTALNEAELETFCLKTFGPNALKDGLTLTRPEPPRSIACCALVPDLYHQIGILRLCDII